MGYDSCNQMLTKPKTVWLTARCRACGTLDHPLRHQQQSSRASRVVDDPTRYLLISMDMKTSDEIVRQNLTEWVNGGVVIEDHRYSFLGFTENHVRKGRIIFFREDENWTVDRLLSYLGDGLRDVFMSSGYGKYAARLGLSFSSTWESLNVPEDQTVLLPPWKAVDGSDHSDGCGMICDSFAAQVCKHHDLPIDTTVFQIRRGGIKGLLVRYPDHKFDTLCCAANCRSQALVAYRQSMSKYEGGPTILELIGYSHCLGSARLNFSFILLLLTLGIKLEVFKRFLKDQLDLIGCILHDRDVAERYVKGELDAVDNGFGQDLYALLLAKHDLKEPYVRWKLQQYQRTQYEQLRKKMNLRVEDSCYVYGVVDEDGILAEDEVFISLPARTGVIVREVLVCRNPAYAAGDLRKFRAVNYETLKHHKYCIVFSRKAARSIPDTMSSGDLDGDTYFVTWDPTLLPQKMAPPQERRNVAHAAVDPSQHRRRSDRLAHGMAQAAVETFLRHKFNAVVGTMVNEWKREAQATSLLADAPYPRALVPIIESAHDMLKSGSDPEMIRKQFYALKKKAWQKETTFTSPIDVLRGLIPEANSQSITNFICDPALILRGEDEEKWRWFSEEARILLPQFNRALRDAIRLDEDASDDDTSESPRYQDRPIRHSEQCKLDYQGRYFGGGSHYDLYLQKLRASAWYCYGYSRKKVAFAWLGERYLNDIRAHWTNGGKPILYIGTSALSGSAQASSSQLDTSCSCAHSSSTLPNCHGMPPARPHDALQTCSACSDCINRELVNQALVSVDANPRPKLPVASTVPACGSFQDHSWSIVRADQARRCYMCDTCEVEVTERKMGKSWVSESVKHPDAPSHGVMTVCNSPITLPCNCEPDGPAVMQDHMVSNSPPGTARPGTAQELMRVWSGVTLVDDSDEAMSVSSDGERAPVFNGCAPAPRFASTGLAGSSSLTASPCSDSTGRSSRPPQSHPPGNLSVRTSRAIRVCARSSSQLDQVLVRDNPKPKCPVATPNIPCCTSGEHRWKLWGNATSRHYTCNRCSVVCKERHWSPETGGLPAWVPYK